MAITLESRPNRGRRLLVGLTVFLAIAVALNYQFILDRFHSRIATPAFQATTMNAPMLYLPTLGKTAPVIFSTTRDEPAVQNDLDKGVSLDVESPRPGQAGNVFLTGHSNNWPWRGEYRTFSGILTNCG